MHMEEVTFLFLFISVNSQPLIDLAPKPERCNRPAEFMFRQCCIFPPFFVRNVAQDCGAKIEVTRRAANVTLFRRQPLTVCEHWKCVLHKYALLNVDGTLDDEKYYAHIDRWLELNPEFVNVMMNAKVHCKNAYRMFLPLKVCEFFNLHGCIRNFINVDCPLTIQTKECAEFKVFFDECREFYL